MKTVFAVSLCKEGLQGGGLYADGEKLTYRTGKLQLGPRFRNLELPLRDIVGVSKGWILLALPTVTIQMRNGEAFRFVIYARKDFFKTLRELGIEA